MTTPTARFSLNDGLYIAREALSTPGTRHATAGDLLPVRAGTTPDRHLVAAVNWLCRAQDVSRVGGVSYGYDLRRGWQPPYPETTGYIITTLLEAMTAAPLAGAADDLRKRAVRLGSWLIGVQLPSGAIPGGTVARDPQETVFNTGQVLDGWCRLWLETQQAEFAAAAAKASRWMKAVQDDDGCWRQALSVLAQKTPATYNVRSAAVLLHAGEMFDEPSWRRAAIRNADWVLTQQHENGWFENNCVMDNTQPLTHTIGYTLEGLLDIAARTGEERFLAAVRCASDVLVRHVAPDGFLSGRFDAGWRPTAPWSCLTGSAQLAMVWFRLSRMTGDRTYAEAARRALGFVQRTQLLGPARGEAANVVGGIKGSHPVWGRYEPFVYPNWATKFFCDALLESGTIPAVRADAPPAGAAGLRVGYVVEDYPTFIVSEIAELRRLGAEVTIFSAFRPIPERDPAKDAVRREAIYLPSGRGQALAANLRMFARRPARYLAAARTLIRHRESLRFLVLGAWHAEIAERRRLNHLHGTFGTRTTTLAHVVSVLADIDYSFTTHAYDVFRPNPSLVWKTNGSAFMRTISRFNRAYIETAYPGVDSARIRVVYLGVDAPTIQAAVNGNRNGNGDGPAHPLRIMAIGSLIAQKGHVTLVHGCGRLRDRGVTVDCRIIGDGPYRDRLEREIAALGLTAHVRLEGDLPHDRTLRELAGADVFALPCIDMRGRGEHVDGIPVVLMEAMAMGIPVVSTDLSGIPELIESGRSGLLVPPENAEALADAIERLAYSPALRSQLGAAARRTTAEAFDLARNTSALASMMRMFAAPADVN